MPGESEYHRCYTAPTRLSPEPTGIAGASSAHLAVTQEPPLGHKRKPPGHERKVTFTTDHTEHGSPTKEDDKVLRFRAGFRRSHVPTPTEYNMQYTWKEPVGESPLLAAANMLREDEQGSEEGAEPNGNPGKPPPQSVPPPEPSRPSEGMEPARNHHHHHHRSKSKTSPPKNPKSHHKSPKDSKKSSTGRKKHKKAHQHPSRLLSEYRAQFKPWPVTAAHVHVKPGADGAMDGARSGASTPPAGRPAILHDPSDPRLLKHSPLSALKSRPYPLSFQRGSEYANNFHSPTEFKFVGGAWQQHPEGSDAGEDEDKHGKEQHSWFDQVTELREKAAQYRHRAESSQLSSLRLLRLRQDQRDLLERASISSSTLSSSTSHPSGSSSACSSDSSSRSGNRSPPVEPEGDVHLEDVEEESGDLSSQEDESNEPALNRNANNNLPEGVDDYPHVEHPHSPQPAPTETPAYEGRVPTPILQEASDERLQYRHHLNRTTPSVGGLLVSPVKPPYPSSSPKYRKDMKSRAPIFPSPGQESQPAKQRFTSGDDHPGPIHDPKIRSSKPSPLRPATTGFSKPVSQGRPTLLTYSPPRTHSHSATSKLRSGGAFRKLTFDSLRDPAHSQHKRDLQASHGRKQAASSFQSCETCGALLKSSAGVTGSGKPAARVLLSKGRDHSKPQVGDPLAATLSSSRLAHRSSLLSKHSHCSVPHTTGIHGQSPKLADFRRPTAVGQPDRDADELSLSSLSLSSCSVASEVLRRAQKRRDNFWMQPRTMAT